MPPLAGPSRPSGDKAARPEALDGQAAQWLEPVTDEQHHAQGGTEPRAWRAATRRRASRVSWDYGPASSATRPLRTRRGSNANREIYSNDDLVVHQYYAGVIATAQTPEGARRDLLNRMLIFDFIIPEGSAGLTLNEIEENFEAERPRILGALCSALAKALAGLDAARKAMKVRASSEPQRLIRMAEAATWGYAIAEALGLSGEKFIDWLLGKVALQEEYSQLDDPVVEAIKEWIDQKGRLEGTPSEIFRKLRTIALTSGINRGIDRWPQSPGAFGKRLSAIEPSLAKMGISVTRSKSGPRRIVIERKTPPRG